MLTEWASQSDEWLPHFKRQLDMGLSSASDCPSNGTHPHCDYCGLPAVCIGSDLAAPQRRCPHHCRENRQLGGVHGDANYLQGHMASEGVAVGGVVASVKDTSDGASVNDASGVVRSFPTETAILSETSRSEFAEGGADASTPQGGASHE